MAFKAKVNDRVLFNEFVSEKRLKKTEKELKKPVIKRKRDFYWRKRLILTKYSWLGLYSLNGLYTHDETKEI